MKNYFILAACLICSILVACKDDDDAKDSQETSIIGVWVSRTLPLKDESSNIIGDAVAYMWYKENGQFIEADCLLEHESGNEWIELSEKGIWTVRDNTVTQTTNFDDDDVFDTDVYKYERKGNSLFMTHTEDGEVITEEMKCSTVEVIQNIIDTYKNSHNE